VTPEQIIAEARGLSDADLRRVHREVCRMAAAIYGPMYRQKQEAGVNAARARQQAGYAEHRERMQRIGVYK